MANVIIKSDERKAQQESVLRSFGVTGRATASQREAAEHISMRSSEAYNQLKKMGGKK